MLNYQSGLDQVYHALADQTRRQILTHLSRGPASVSELAKPLAMSLPAVLQHLQVLEGSGIVLSKKVGRVRTCSIEPKALSEAEKWISGQRTVWEQRFDQLNALLLEEQRKSGAE